jgi:hypothetical protein
MAKGLEASHQCMIGVGSEPDTVIMVATFESKERNDSLPEDPNDLERLNQLRAPFFEELNGSMEEAVQIYDTIVTMGAAPLEILG